MKGSRTLKKVQQQTTKQTTVHVSIAGKAGLYWPGVSGRKRKFNNAFQNIPVGLDLHKYVISYELRNQS